MSRIMLGLRSPNRHGEFFDSGRETAVERRVLRSCWESHSQLPFQTSLQLGQLLLCFPEGMLEV